MLLEIYLICFLFLPRFFGADIVLSARDLFFLGLPRFLRGGVGVSIFSLVCASISCESGCVLVSCDSFIVITSLLVGSICFSNRVKHLRNLLLCTVIVLDFLLSAFLM